MIPAYIPPLLATRHVEKPDGICQWFALCDKPTPLGIEHPALGMRRCCESCAEQVGLSADLVQILEPSS